MAYELLADAGDDIACFDTTRTYSRRALAELVAELAAELADRGVHAAGGEVLLCAEDRLEFLISLLACFSLGVVAALPPSRQAGALTALATRPSTQLVLGATEPVHPARQVAVDLPRLLSAKGASKRTFFPLSLAAEDVLVTVYTSGSTGEPLRCRKTARQLLGEVKMLIDCFGFGRHSTVLATVPFHHIYGLLFGALVPLTCGARVALNAPLHAQDLRSTLREFAATDLISVPAHLQGLALAPLASSAPGLRIFSSAAPLPTSTASVLRASHQLIEILGSSETGGIAWREGPTPWRPLPGVNIGVSDAGLLRVQSPFVPPEGPDGFVSQDRIELYADGSFTHLGRADGVRKIAGKRVSLEEIEARARSFPQVTDAACLALPSGSIRGTELGLVVSPASVSTAELRNELLRYFDPVVVPRRLRTLDVLPREATGKLKRDSLLALFANSNNPPAAAFRWGPTTVEATVDEVEPEQKTLRLSLEVPASLSYFSGHFPDHPVLPAVVQLSELVLASAENAWPELGQLERAQRIKFKAPISPGDRLELELCLLPATGVLRFRILRSKSECSVGILQFRPLRPSGASRSAVSEESLPGAGKE